AKVPHTPWQLGRILGAPGATPILKRSSGEKILCQGWQSALASAPAPQGVPAPTGSGTQLAGHRSAGNSEPLGSLGNRSKGGHQPRGAGSAERAGDVLLGRLFARAPEDLPGVAVLRRVAGAAALAGIDVEERRLVGDARRLLHVVRHDGDGVLLLQL